MSALGRRLCCSLHVLLLAMTSGLVVLSSLPAAPASAALTPPDPPAPVNPQPYLKEVTTPGPTRVGQGSGYVKAQDMVWGPQGSPYVVAGWFHVAATESLTLLPGTVVKFDYVDGSPASRHDITSHGRLLVLGTPDRPVVFTSIRDDNVMGDTNGDGAATQPAEGDWEVITAAGPTYINYADVRYGGAAGTAMCGFGGNITVINDGRAVIANSRFSHSATAGIHINLGGRNGYAGIFNNEFRQGRCGLAAPFSDTPAVVTGNTFAADIRGPALYAHSTDNLFFRYNTAYRPIDNRSPDPGTDIRFNSLLGGIEDGDGRSNWYGSDTNNLPPCMTQAEMDAHIPRLRAKSGVHDCPDGAFAPEPIGVVLPTLSTPPGVVPPSLFEAAAANYGPVDTHRGVLRYQTTDMTVHDAGKALSATRTYQSNRSGEGDAGPGWTTAYSEALSTVNGVSALTLSDGSSVPFTMDPAAGYSPAAGVVADFQTGTEGSAVTNAGRTTYQFNATGDLTGILLGDAGHRVDVQRSGGRLASVTGVSGRYLSYARSGGRLTQLTDSQERTVSLSYTDGRLTGVTGVDGQTERYEYDAAGRMTKVIASSGLVKLAAGYRADGKVAWVEEAGKGRVSFAYDGAKTTITRADGSQLVQTLDGHGLLVEEQVVGGAARHFIHDMAGRAIVRVEGVPTVPLEGYQPIANATLLDGRGDPIVTIDAGNRTVLTTFNTAHHPLVSTFPDGGTVTRSYAADGRLTNITDQLGKAWSYTYDSRGQVLTQTNPLNQTQRLAYETDGDLASITDPTVAITTFEYDPFGRRTAVVNPAGHRTGIDYTVWGEVRRTTSPSGATTTNEFDTDRRPTVTVDPVGGRTSRAYDGQGRLVSTVDALGQRSSMEYDTVGRPRKIIDGRGAVTQLSYSADDHVIASTDGSGATTTAVNDPAGRPMRVTDALGQVTQLTYDPAGQVIKIERPDGSAVSDALDAMGRVTTHKTALGYSWKYNYDLAGRHIKTEDPMGYVRQWAYDELGRVISVTDELGRVAQQSYDDASRTVTTTDTIGTASIVAHNVLGQVASVTDGAGGVSQYEYDADGRWTAEVDPMGGRTTYGYDAAGRLTSITDPVARTMSAAMDALGRASAVTDAAGKVTSYTYEPGGQVASVTDRTGAVSSFAYDIRGLLTTATDPLGNVTTYAHDGLGRQIKVTDPTGAEQNTAYDPVGRPAVLWDAIGSSETMTHDLDGNLTGYANRSGAKWTYGYNRRGELTEANRSYLLYKWKYTYDKAGHLASTSRPHGGGKTVRYTYDQRGRLTAMTDEADATATWQYDGTGHRTSQTSPLGHIGRWTYDAAGRTTSAVDGLGNTSQYAYDAAGQVTSVTTPRGGESTYTYTGLGEIATETKPDGSVTRFFHDEEGRPIRTETPAGRIIHSRYDAAGRLHETEAGGVIRTLGYDAAARLTSAHVDGQPDLALEYNNRGLLTSTTDRSGVTRYEYDDAGRIIKKIPTVGVATSYSYVTGSTATPGLGLLDKISGPMNVDYDYDYEERVTKRSFTAPWANRTDKYTYGTNGRLTSMQEGASAPTTLTYNPDGQIETVSAPDPAGGANKVGTYGYDAGGRLTSQQLMKDTTVLESGSYGWDADGNRTSVTKDSGSPTTFTYDITGMLQSSSDGATYSHDEDGNRIGVHRSGQLTSFGFNSFGELTSADHPAGGYVTYARDPLGRVGERSSGGGNEHLGYTGAGSMPAWRAVPGGASTDVVLGHNGEVVGQAAAGGSALRAIRNQHSDVTGWQDNATNAITATTTYDPFGQVTASTGSAVPLNLGYQSSRTDSGTGLVDMGFRSYDPATAHFTAADNIIGSPDTPASFNRYAYGFGDPINYFDPDGHWPQWLDNYLNWWASEWSAGWNDAESTVEAPPLVGKVNTWIDEHKADITTFAVSAAAFVGCEIAVGAPTAGVGAVAGLTACGAAAGAIGGLAGQAVRCTEKKTDNACDPEEFIRVGITDGIAGAIGGGAGGFVGRRASNLLAGYGANPVSRTVAGTAVGGSTGLLGGGAAGFGAGTVSYGLTCYPQCTISGLAATAWDSTKRGALFGAAFGFAGAGVGVGVTTGIRSVVGSKTTFYPGTSKVGIDPYQGVKDASKLLRGAGVPRQFRAQTLQSFEVGTIRVRTVGDNEYAMRFYDGVNADAQGRFLTQDFGASRAQLALKPDWNQMSGIKQWQLRPGATIIEGRISGQGLGYPGGSSQIYVLDPKADLLDPGGW